MQPNKVTHFTSKEFAVVLLGYIETNESIEFVTTSSLRLNFYICQLPGFVGSRMWQCFLLVQDISYNRRNMCLQLVDLNIKHIQIHFGSGHYFVGRSVKYLTQISYDAYFSCKIDMGCMYRVLLTRRTIYEVVLFNHSAISVSNNLMNFKTSDCQWA